MHGQAMDRHLLGLKLIAQDAGMEIPDFFKDESHSRSLHHFLPLYQPGIIIYDIVLLCVHACICVCYICMCM